MSCDSSHRGSCGGSGSAWASCDLSHHSSSADEIAAEPIAPPQLLCACKIPLGRKTSHTTRNPERDYYQCQKVGTNGNFVCKTWIWVDLVSDYVEQMVKFRRFFLVEEINRELEAVKMELAVKEQNDNLRDSKDEVPVPTNLPDHIFGASSSRGVAVQNKKYGELKVASGKLVFKPCPSPQNVESTRNHPAINNWINLDEYTDGERLSSSTPFPVHMTESVLPQGPPLFDATPNSVPPGPPGAQSLFVEDADEESEEDFDEPQVPEDDDFHVENPYPVYGVSPFTLGVSHAETRPSVCRHVSKMAEKTYAVEARRTWFRHGGFSITCGELRALFAREGRFSVLIVDGLVIVYRTMDRVMYLAAGITDNMWRHWMPASFATAVVDGDDWLSPRFRDMFIGDHLDYNVSNCRMIIMALPRNGRWAAYVWDFLKKVLTVLDPCMQQKPVSQLRWEHDDTMDCLHQALFDCKDAWMPSWNVDRHNWEYNHPIAIGRSCRGYNSGVYTMHYALWFDGTEVKDLSVEGKNDIVRSGMLCKMLNMPGNTGDLPDFLPKEV